MGRMKIISLQSGSNGNCIYVEAGGVRLLFDAGLSGIQAKQRLARHGREIAGIDGLFISHDHSDHAKGMGVFHRKFGLPVYATEKTHCAASRYGIGAIGDLRHFQAGDVVRFGSVAVETIPTPHDGVDGVMFVVDDGHRRLGILTDLGHVFNDLRTTLRSLDAVLLESNYDPAMLARGDYPPWLKQRIRGPGGHLSNQEAANLIAHSASSRLQWLCLGHLSNENNTPEIALDTHRRTLGHSLAIVVATRHEPTDVLAVAPNTPQDSRLAG